MSMALIFCTVCVCGGVWLQGQAEIMMAGGTCVDTNINALTFSPEMVVSSTTILPARFHSTRKVIINNPQLLIMRRQQRAINQRAG